jgi:hypothetical protein
MKTETKEIKKLDLKRESVKKLQVKAGLRVGCCQSGHGSLSRPPQED